jgi:hypothetical protein
MNALTRILKTSAVALAIAGSLTMPASARGFRGGGFHGGYHGRGWVGPAIGGAIVGGALAYPYYYGTPYYAPAPYQPSYHWVCCNAYGQYYWAWW